MIRIFGLVFPTYATPDSVPIFASGRARTSRTFGRRSIIPVEAVPASKTKRRFGGKPVRGLPGFSKTSIRENVFQAVYIGARGGLALLAVTEIGKTLSAQSASGKAKADNAAPTAASFLSFLKPKTAAANSPSIAATTTEPEPPKVGITIAIAAQPAPAPIKSKA